MDGFGYMDHEGVIYDTLDQFCDLRASFWAMALIVKIFDGDKIMGARVVSRTLRARIFWGKPKIWWKLSQISLP